jgi:hypothetical protein
VKKNTNNGRGVATLKKIKNEKLALPITLFAYASIVFSNNGIQHEAGNENG